MCCQHSHLIWATFVFYCSLAAETCPHEFQPLYFPIHSVLHIPESGLEKERERERERKRERERGETIWKNIQNERGGVCKEVCVCLCLWERERDERDERVREREREREDMKSPGRIKLNWVTPATWVQDREEMKDTEEETNFFHENTIETKQDVWTKHGK